MPNLKKGKIMMNKTQRPNTRAGIYLPNDSDKKQREESRAYYVALSNEDLVKAYNREVNIFGVHAQMVKLYVVHNIFLERFGESPIVVQKEVIYCLGPKIFYSKELDAIFPITEN